MGWLVGDADGLWLGCDVGLNVAGVVGLAVKVVGLDVTGLAEGDTLGPTVGFKLGDDVGLVLGLPVTGFAVGGGVIGGGVPPHPMVTVAVQKGPP